MNKKIFINTLFLALATYAIYLRLPDILNHFRYQDKQAPEFQISILNGNKISLKGLDRKIILVFWATWCGPCEVELKRINKLILEKKLSPDDVLAIASGEKFSDILETAKKNNYLFNIGIDENRNISHLYQVTSTPTIVFINEHSIIDWMSSGLSPTLEYRINSFFK